MSLGCGIGYYAVGDAVTSGALCELLTAAGYELLGDYSASAFLYCSLKGRRFRIDITPLDAPWREIEQRELAPPSCKVVLEIGFDKHCFGELIDLVQLLMKHYGGLVIEGLGDQTRAYDAQNIQELPKHPIWREGDDSE